MASLDELKDTFQAAMTLAGVDSRTIERNPGSTIVPIKLRVDTAGKRAFGLLAELAEGGDKLDLHGTLGEGGMGVVRLATQRSLGREVAVKTLKADHRNDHTTLKLLREAWVTGSLEHPNVVPVYDIALEGDGSPLIVLKKIEGDEWASLIHDARAVKDRFGAEDLLEWNLRTFMQVCNAVRYAHSRAVLHRDLKPENVMIGRFGEVYVVDWGIAVSLEDDGSGRMPLASEATELAGTPLYMAPEMLGGKTSRLSERTDVYLLGSLLYEIVAGRPPHQGTELMEIVAAIVDSNPEIGEDAPLELRRVIRRAMDPDPDARFENVEQVRLSVQGFLQHRDAGRIAELAEERAVELTALLTERPEEDEDPEAREAIYRLFGESRFGFRHALEVWPENEMAREGLDRAIAAMIEYELRESEPEAARALLTEMDDVPEGLAERVEAARLARSEEDAQLRRLRDDHDPTQGRRTRVVVASIMGVLWTVTPIISHVLLRVYAIDLHPGHEVIVSGIFLGVIAGLGLWARESMMRTSINRRIGFAGVIAVLSPFVANLVSWLRGGDLYETMSGVFLPFAVIAAMLAATIDWRILVTAVTYLVAYLLMPFVGPANVFLVLGITNLVMLVNIMVLWLRPREDWGDARERIDRRRREHHAWVDKHLRRRPVPTED